MTGGELYWEEEGAVIGAGCLPSGYPSGWYGEASHECEEPQCFCPCHLVNGWPAPCGGKAEQR